MALLIDIRMPEWMTDESLRDVLQPLIPDADIRCGNNLGDPTDIIMLACVKLTSGLARQLPNLQLVQKLGAGVEGIVGDPELPPHVKVARLKPDAPAQEIAEFCLAYVLREQRNMAFHAENQANKIWEKRGPHETPKTTVGVLGLGHIGGRTAQLFTHLGFRVLGWSRSPKDIPNVECRYGLDTLKPLLAECDYVASVLPSTPQTADLFDAAMFAAMKPGAMLINVGRGNLIVEDDLLAALNNGHLGGAVLDVFRTEPVPKDHPFWSHPKITITPHVSGWHLTGGLEDVAENYRRLTAGESLLHQVDREAGY